LLFGDAGNDTLVGDNYTNSSTNDYYVAPEAHGSDTLVGGAGQDELIGYGDDDILGLDGADMLFGDAGNAMRMQLKKSLFAAPYGTT